MKIVFFDSSNLDYSPATSESRPLGGSQSGLCYLSCNMVKAGHRVALVNNISQPGSYLGVECPGIKNGSRYEYLNEFDIVIVLNAPHGAPLRKHGVRPPMVLWCQHDVDQPAVLSLHKAEELESWDGYVMVTNWGAQRYNKVFGIPIEKMSVQRNAMAPMFNNMLNKVPFFRRGDPPELVYSSTPFRGLDLLLMAFPTIRAALPGTRLKVFSSMNVYQSSEKHDPYYPLYELSRALDGVEYVGSVSQPELAQAFQNADIMAYLNTFPELACIAVMEAMASDCLVITSSLGALPETTNGHGFLMDVGKNQMETVSNYAKLTIDTINASYNDPDGFAERLLQQKDYANNTFSWETRADEWVEWLQTLL